VAALAGVPPAVIQARHDPQQQLDFSPAEEAAAPDPLREALAALNPDELTPLQALQALAELKRLLP
jgi:DNA mismatch repair protein MutS